MLRMRGQMFIPIISLCGHHHGNAQQVSKCLNEEHTLPRLV